MGGLIGIDDSWFRTRPTYRGSILEAPSGIYLPNPDMTDAVSGGGIILVFRHNNNNACIFQVTGNGLLFVRTMNVNTIKWSDWKELIRPSFPTI